MIRSSLSPLNAAWRPLDDPARLEAVAREGFRDGSPRRDLAWVAALAQHALAADASLLTFLDADRQHYLSQEGFPAGTANAPVALSLCRFVVERDAPLVVHDAATHPAFADHPAHTEFGVVSYAGVPVRSPDGPVLGALCVLGWTPRHWSAKNLADLETLARVVQDEIELATHRQARPPESGAVVTALPSRVTIDPPARRTLERQIDDGLEAGHFELHYQPMVDLSSGSITAYEALLRWNDPERGLIPPPMFLPRAEHFGLMAPLTRFVVHTACARLAAWSACGPGVPVSINASPREILDPEFPMLIARELAAADVDPALLIIELTEAASDADPGVLATTISALNDLGVRLALDDFGAEHSGLSRLKGLPLDLLKIDRRFLEGIPDDPRAAAIIRAIVSLGQAVGAEVVAEGIETEAQRDFVRDCGCHHGQGWLLGRPVAAGPGAPPYWELSVH
jgi:EAL domain-containing protein (putative c-di-GMP-specific phosphodiesterase class I)